MSGSHNGRRRNRILNPDERALWKYVTRDIERLHRAPTPAPAPAAEPVEARTASPAEAASSPIGKAATSALRPDPAPRPSAPPLAPIEPKLRRRLSRGVHEVEARIDLHGLTQAAAHHRLHSFLVGAQAAGYGVVLVITGKGSGAAEISLDGGRGVLRRVVPQWLAEPTLRSVVIGFETAARGHGGEGALYVRIRRSRGPQP